MLWGKKQEDHWSLTAASFSAMRDLNLKKWGRAIKQAIQRHPLDSAYMHGPMYVPVYTCVHTPHIPYHNRRENDRYTPPPPHRHHATFYFSYVGGGLPLLALCAWLRWVVHMQCTCHFKWPLPVFAFQIWKILHNYYAGHVSMRWLAFWIYWGNSWEKEGKNWTCTEATFSLQARAASRLKRRFKAEQTS